MDKMGAILNNFTSPWDGLWKKLDILGVVSETAIWQYIWYGESSFQIYNNEDRAFYESIKICRRTRHGW